MPNTNPVNSRINGHVAFFREFLRHPRQIGSVVPSSRFLERRILKAASVASSKTIVELGSGTGGTTQAILRAMLPHARLLCVEINPYFHNMISSIEDKRLIAHLGSACGLREIISMYGLDAPDAVISGIPFSTMDYDDGCKVIEAISALLAPDGRFVAYQVSNRVADLCRPFMGSETMGVELINIPPMRVYQWKKQGSIQVKSAVM